jgi:hypothetical protein
MGCNPQDLQCVPNYIFHVAEEQTDFHLKDSWLPNIRCPWDDIQFTIVYAMIL